MQQVATLGITVDANGAIRSVTLLDASLQKLGVTSAASTRNMSALNALHAEAVGHTGAHSLGLNRVERAMASVVERSTGLNSALGILGSSFLKFGVGDVYTVAIVAGLAAVTAAYSALTEGARDAKKAQDEAMASAREAAYAAGPGGSKQASQYAVALKALQDAQGTRAMHAAYGMPTNVDDVGIKGLQLLVDNLYRKLPMGTLSTVSVTGRSQEQLASEAMRAQNEGIRLRDQYDRAMRETYDFAHGYPMSPLLRPLNEGYDNFAKDTLQASLGNLKPAGFSMPAIGMGPVVDQQQRDAEKHQREQLIKLGVLHEDNSVLRDAIQSTAQIIAGVIGAALNIGGGGLGSKIGGALGAGIGGGIGASVGHIGGAILGPLGSVVGGLLGSALGGLFDHHKKAVDKNTQAINALTAALYNAPSGYKVAGARYRADEGRHIYEAASQEAYSRRLRGGVGSLAVAS